MSLPAVTGLTVLHDAECPLCQRFRDWLATQPTYVPLHLVAAGSDEAGLLFPDLDHARTLVEVTVVGDAGQVWAGEHAWVMCLWATVAHRPLAERLATPAGLPLARAAAHAAARMRGPVGARRRVSVGGDYPDSCAGTCSPVPQG